MILRALFGLGLFEDKIKKYFLERKMKASLHFLFIQYYFTTDRNIYYMTNAIPSCLPCHHVARRVIGRSIRDL